MSARTFKSKPVHVQAVEYLPPGQSDEDVVAVLQAWGCSVQPDGHWGDGDWDLRLHVAKGDAWVTVHPGDFIIKERDGSGFYPCARSEFVSRYDEVLIDTDGAKS